MNLRIVPAVPSAPTVIFSLNWHNLPASLSLPSFYANQLASCQDANVPVPRNTLALDKAVGFHLLLESVSFDLARGMVSIVWMDKRVQEWTIDGVEGLRASLEDVLDCVRQSGEEADKEKKAAAAASSPKPTTASATQTPDMTSTPSSSPALGHKRHRTASGIFSSLVASFITPPPTPDMSGNVPPHLAHLYRTRRSKSTSSIVPLYHKQSMMHPANKRDVFPAGAVPQSRFLRRQARAKLVDIFRYYVTSRLTTEMRASGIVGEELKERGILDDIDAEDEDDELEPLNPGASGYISAGGYVAFMARSMLRNALAEAKAEDDSLSSSSEDSLLLTPPSRSDTSLPSDSDANSKSQSKATPSTPRRRATTPSPQARQIRNLSSVLIGLTQKDKRSLSEEREMLELVKDRSLRRRWSLCEASSSSRLTDANGRVAQVPPPSVWTKPVISSPLRNWEVAEDETVVLSAAPEPAVPFPSDVAAVSTASPVPFPTEGVSRRTRSVPSPPPSPLEGAIAEAQEASSEDVPEGPHSKKAAEAEDILSSRTRRPALLASSPVSSSPRPSPIQTAAPSDESDLMNLPSPKYSEHDEHAGKRYGMSFPEDVDVDEEEEDRVSPPPQYAPSLPTSPMDASFGDVKTTSALPEEPRGLELKVQVPAAYWPDGVYVV